MSESKIVAQSEYCRIYTDARAKWGWYGETHFELIRVEQNPVNAASVAPLMCSRADPASEFLFCSLEPGRASDWQPSPARQFMVLLQGSMEVETSDAEAKRFHTGDIILLEDTWGKGHRVRKSERHLSTYSSFNFQKGDVAFAPPFNLVCSISFRRSAALEAKIHRWPAGDKERIDRQISLSLAGEPGPGPIR